LRLIKLSKKVKILIIALAIIAKAFLAAITPLSIDFINIAISASWYAGGLVYYGPYTLSIYLISLFHKLWMLMPINPKPFYAMLGSGELFKFSLNALLATFMLKLPLLILDLLTGALCYAIVFHSSNSKPLAFSALMLWLLNPYTTIVVEMDGTMDIISAFLLTASVFLFLKNRLMLSAIALSIATMARFYPLALFPFFLIVLIRNKEIKNLITFIIAYIAPILMALSLFISKHGIGFLWRVYELPVTSAQSIPEFTWFFGHIAYGFVFPKSPISIVATLYVLYAFIAYRLWKPKREVLLEAILCVLISFVAFSHWNRYYTTWIIPFLTIDYALHKKESKPGVYSALFFLFFFSAFLYNAVAWWFSSLLFIPPYNQTLEYLTSLIVGFYEWAGPGALFHTFARSLLAGVSIIYLAKAVFRNLGSAFSFL
jgi:hypothetical protein